MALRENLITTLDRFKAVVYLKDMGGRYLSMNQAGIQVMNRPADEILGKTAHDLFDISSANTMIQTDHHSMVANQIQTSVLNSKDRSSGKPLPMFSAKVAIRTTGKIPLGIVGMSLMDCQDSEIFREACRLLPQFVQQKHRELLKNLLQLKTVTEFMNVHRLQ